MSRRLVYPLLIVLVAALLLLLEGRRDARPAAPGRNADPARAAPNESALAPDVPNGPDGQSRRTPSFSAPPAAPPDGPAWRARALRAEDDQPLPGAEIHLLDRGRPDAPPLPDGYLDPLAIERLVTTHGTRHDTGSDGRVLLPPLRGDALLVARHGDRFAFASLQPPAPPELRLELRASPPVRVLVVDERGAPASGVEVGLRTVSASPSLALRRARTGADGRADFHRVRDFLPGARDQRLAVALELLLPEAVAADLPAGPPPAEPIRLILPATGRVEIQPADAAAGLPAHRGAVMLHAVLPDGSDPGAFAALTSLLAEAAPDGVARFEHVGLGLRLEARAALSGFAQLSTGPFAGPASNGATVTARLRGDLAITLLAGRALDAERRPLASTTLWASLEFPVAGGGRRQQETIRTDAGGAFQLAWSRPPHAPDEDTEALELSVRAAGGAGVAAAARVLLPAPLGPGRVELGDLVLVPAPIVVAGRILDGDGTGVPAAVVMIEQFLPLGTGPDDGLWQADYDLRAQSDAGGDFMLRGTAPPGRLRLAVLARGFLPATLECAAGETGLVLRLARTAALAGSLLLPVDVPPSLLFLAAELTGDEAATPHRPEIDAGGSFRWPTLAPGLYRVTIGIPGAQAETLFELDGILLQGGDDLRDPRLEGIDLRERLRYLEIEIADEDGVALPMASVREDGDPSAGGSWSALRGRARILTTRWPLTLVVEAPGYRPATLPGVSGAARAVLHRGLRASLVLDAPPALRPGESFTVTLVPDAPGAWFDVARSRFDGDGRAEVVLSAPGSYRALLSLAIQEGRQHGRVLPLGGREDAPLLSVSESDGIQLFSLRIDPDTFERVRAGAGGR